MISQNGIWKLILPEA